MVAMPELITNTHLATAPPMANLGSHQFGLLVRPRTLMVTVPPSAAALFHGLQLNASR